ncbi:MAG: LD-carboxypeptidase [Bryobacteraceae bacterium]|nr:LD-carboxypeptidase [Bryobacteraceae bacterium]
MKPKALQPGDTVGLITPSTFVSDPDALANAERTVKYFGLKAKWGPNVRKKHGYVGGSVQERLDDLHAMFADGDVKAVFPIRGGYGSGQILDRIDYDLIRRNPKIFLGYSDITAMHLAILKKTGLVTLHGPVMLSGYTDYTIEHLRRALFENKPLGVLTNPPDTNRLRPRHPLRAVRGGKASGRLIGGNLSLIAATMGTPFEIDTRGKIFFIEDVDEQPYSIDRMLTNLRLAGKLQAAAGIVFGECSSCAPRDYKPSFNNTLLLGEVVDEILGGLNIPVLSGLTIGHTADQLTLPLGVLATLDADKGELTVDESAVL